MARPRREYGSGAEPPHAPGISGEWSRLIPNESSLEAAPLIGPIASGASDLPTRLLLRLANFVANMGMGVESTLEALDEAQRAGAPTLEHVQAIRDSMHRMVQYVRDVEALLTPTTASVTVSPASIIESRLEDLSTAEDSSRTVLGRYPVDLWPVALGPDQFEAVLDDVLSNAIEATRELGEVTLEAANVAVPPEGASLLGVLPGDFVRISVRDTGVGLEPHLASKAFDPFFSTWGQDQPWRGLGLTKVRSFVERCGGRCDLRSAAQLGTRVTLLIPRAHVPVLMTEEEPADATSEFPPSTFLIVDDEPLVSGGLARSLTRDGHRVETARDSAQAFSIMGGGTIVDVAVVDWHLGSNSGIEVAKAIRGRYPTTTVVLTTGYAGALSGVAGAEEETLFPVLRKPFSTQTLLSRVLEERHRSPANGSGRS